MTILDLEDDNLNIREQEVSSQPVQSSLMIQTTSAGSGFTGPAGSQDVAGPMGPTFQTGLIVSAGPVASTGRQTSTSQTCCRTDSVPLTQTRSEIHGTAAGFYFSVGKRLKCPSSWVNHDRAKVT